MSKNPELQHGKAPKQTRDNLEKIASIPCLYRHTRNKNYYGIKKHAGKIVKRAFKNATGEPITSLQEAKVALADWLASLGKSSKSATLAERFDGGGQFTLAMMKDLIHASGSDEETKDYVLKTHFGLTTQEARAHGIDLSPLEKSEAEINREKEEAKKHKSPTLAQCFDEFSAMKSGFSASSLQKYKYAKRAFELHGGKELLKKHIATITTQELIGFYVGFPQTFKPQYFNTFSIVVNQVFEMARLNGYIKENPLSMMPKNIRRRKVPITRDVVPTIEQCEAIVAEIRKNSYVRTREESADMTAFLHLAALGEAEANSLTWGDIDFERGVLKVTRIKTQQPFEVPIYPFLKPFLEQLAAKRRDQNPESKLFNLLSIKKALQAACRRLDYPVFSPRDLRKARITWLLRKGYPIELIADAQGHKDGGVLIRRVYSNVIDEAKDTYKKEQLAKLV